MTRQSPALVSAEREADRLALAAARAEVKRLTRIIDGYDRAMLWASRELDALLRAALDGQVQG